MGGELTAVAAAAKSLSAEVGGTRPQRGYGVPNIFGKVVAHGAYWSPVDPGPCACAGAQRSTAKTAHIVMLLPSSRKLPPLGPGVPIVRAC